MTMHIAFELDDNELRHFELIMREARKSAANAAPELIVAAAEELLLQVGNKRVPPFIMERLEKLGMMTKMLADQEWRLPEVDAARVLNALAYFCEPEDLIPDDIPGIGYLDDAIMIELVATELTHEIEAYIDFCKFRDSSPSKAGVKARSSDVTREDWLDKRRAELQSRMHRRQKRGDRRSR
jgi:uncharacterized membrane protein YkvA (DUF1232 family)